MMRIYTDYRSWSHNSSRRFCAKVIKWLEDRAKCEMMKLITLIEEDLADTQQFVSWMRPQYCRRLDKSRGTLIITNCKLRWVCCQFVGPNQECLRYANNVGNGRWRELMRVRYCAGDVRWTLGGKYETNFGSFRILNPIAIRIACMLIAQVVRSTAHVSIRMQHNLSKLFVSFSFFPHLGEVRWIHLKSFNSAPFNEAFTQQQLKQQQASHMRNFPLVLWDRARQSM